MVSSVGLGVGVAGAAAAALLAAWHAIIYYEVDYKCERPKYVVVYTVGSRTDWLGRSKPIAEIRKYPSLLAAQIAVADGDMRKALGTGFRALAGFIFGKNIAGSGSGSAKVAMTAPVMDSMPSKKIAMTAPVAAAMEGDKHVVSFVMPSNYTKETLPKPVNEDVKIVEIPSRTLAAMAWRGGSPSESTVHAREAELRSAMESAGLRAKGPVHLWQYHPPFAPFYVRLNEVLLEVDESAGGATSMQ